MLLDSFKTVKFENTRSKIILQLNLPDDWSFSKANKTTLNIMRSGNKIGIITSGKFPTYIEDYDTVCNTIGNTEASMQIARYKENIVNVQKAINEHFDTAVLSWKNEINALIDSGVNYDDFCINDVHKHSTPLAGYVGAHMIYRSIFKTTPPSLSDNAPLTNEYVNTKLNNYIASGGKIQHNSVKIYQIS